jgi:hypothetical protein
MGMMKALIKTEGELYLPPEIQAGDNGSIEWIKSFEFVLLTTIRSKVLQCTGDNNKALQSSKVTMEGGAKNVSRLVKEIQTMKDSWLKLFEEAKQVASDLSIDPELKRGSRIRKKKRFFDYTGDGDYSFSFESPDIHFKI